MPLPWPSRRAARRLCLPVVTVLALTACGTAGGPADELPEHDRAATGPGTCVEPPELPTDVPTYSADQLPDPAPAETFTATISTNCGDLTVELYGDEAPTTVGSFLTLADQGYWRDSPCHRLTTAGIFVLQCGDPTGTGRGGPGYTFDVEGFPADGNYPTASLAMARGEDTNSNGGQFFIVYDASTLQVSEGGYTLFGRVVDGMEVVDRVAEQGVDGGGPDGMPAQRISILNVEVNP